MRQKRYYERVKQQNPAKYQEMQEQKRKSIRAVQSRMSAIRNKSNRTPEEEALLQHQRQMGRERAKRFRAKLKQHGKSKRDLSAEEKERVREYNRLKKRESRQNLSVKKGEAANMSKDV